MRFGQLLTMLREQKGYNKTEFGARVGTSGEYISMLESGRKRPPPIVKVNLYADQLGLSGAARSEFVQAAILDRSPSEARSIMERAIAKKGGIQLTDDAAQYEKVPQLGACPASSKNWVLDEVEAWHYLPRDLVKGRKLYLLRAKGDSMNRAGIDSGDLVLVDCGAQPMNGNVVAIAVDHEYTMKRYYKNGDQITLMPESTNPDHAVQFYDVRKNEIRVCGVVDSVYMKKVR